MSYLYKVKKKDNSLEDFDRNKIVQGIIKAGGSVSDAEYVATQIEASLPTTAVNGVIKSLDICNKVLESLRLVNPTVAKNFESYKKQ